MKILSSLIPVIIGVAIVLQGGLNRRMGGHLGLPSTLFVGTLCSFTAATLYFTLSGPRIEPLLRAFSPWFVVPGILGFCIILGIPWAMARIGAVQAFLLLVSAQIAASAAWDAKIEGLPLSSTRVAGIVLAWAGTLLASGALSKGR